MPTTNPPPITTTPSKMPYSRESRTTMCVHTKSIKKKLATNNAIPTASLPRITGAYFWNDFIRRQISCYSNTHQPPWHNPRLPPPAPQDPDATPSPTQTKTIPYTRELPATAPAFSPEPHRAQLTHNATYPLALQNLSNAYAAHIFPTAPA